MQSFSWRSKSAYVLAYSRSVEGGIQEAQATNRPWVHFRWARPFQGLPHHQ